MRKILLTLLLLFCGEASAAQWDAVDRAMFGSFVVLETVDVAQTWKIHQHPDQYRENNPLYGSDPNMAAVIGIKALVIGGVYYVVRDASSVERKLLLGVLDALQLSVTAHNYSIGLKLGF